MKNNEMMYQFVGGDFNGMTICRLEAERLASGHTPDYSEARATGGFCCSEILDNQPMIDGYVGPMVDGERYLVDGELKYSFECTEEEKENFSVTILRYETQRVYDMLSE